MGIFEDLEARVTANEEKIKALAEEDKRIIASVDEIDKRVEALENAPPIEPPPVEPPVTPGFKLGINFHQLATWSQERLYSNALMNGSPWRLCKATSPLNPFSSTGELPALNEMGLPIISLPMASGLTIRTDIFCDNGEKYPVGDYHLQFEGAGEIQLISGTKTQTFKAPGGVFNISTTNKLGITLVISTNNAVDPIKNLKLIKREDVAHVAWEQQFLKPFYIHRFMDLQKTNNSKVTNTFVSDYAIPHPENGAPAELLRWGHPWFCLPHLSTEKFNRDMAAWVKAHLFGTIYIEYSNELWNGQFDQTKWIFAKAQSTGKSFQEIIAIEAVSRFKIWEEVFGTERSRLKFVVAGQNASIGVAKDVAKHMALLNFKFDVISSAPYFNENSGVFSTSVATVLSNCKTYLETKTIPGMKTHIDLAKAYSTQFGKKVEYVAYEAGQHLVPGKSLAHTQAYIDAQNTPEMKAMYKQLIKAAKDNGGDGMVLFNSCQVNKDSGCWGLIQSTGQDLTTSVKYQAVVESTL